MVQVQVQDEDEELLVALLLLLLHMHLIFLLLSEIQKKRRLFTSTFTETPRNPKETSPILDTTVRQGELPLRMCGPPRNPVR